MPRSEGQKGKLVWLLRILARYTDEEHLINVPRILELLAAEGIAAERKSVYDDIATLRALGYDIVSTGDGAAAIIWPAGPSSCPSSSCWQTRCRPPVSSPAKRAIS